MLPIDNDRELEMSSAALALEGSHDPRDARLPGEPPEGFRNLLNLHAAAEHERWAGLGDPRRTAELMRKILLERPAAPLAFGGGLSPRLRGVLRLALEDFGAPLDARVYPPPAIDGPALRRLRLLGEAARRSRLPAEARPAADALLDAEREARRAGPRGGDAAARGAARVLYRRVLFDRALPALLAPEVRAAYEDGLRLDRWSAAVDDAPVEFTHILAPLLREALRGPGDDAREAARHVVESAVLAAGPLAWRVGPLTVEALADGLRPALGAGSLAVEPGARAALVQGWIGDRPAFAGSGRRLCEDPPLSLFLALEAAAPENKGGGGGRRLGALGSAILAEALYAARDLSRAAAEHDPEAMRAFALAFGDPRLRAAARAFG